MVHNHDGVMARKGKAKCIENLSVLLLRVSEYRNPNPELKYRHFSLTFSLVRR